MKKKSKFKEKCRIIATVAQYYETFICVVNVSEVLWVTQTLLFSEGVLHIGVAVAQEVQQFI